MARYRTIQTDFWSDPYIEELSAYRKLLYIYLFTSPHTQNSGVLNVTAKKIAYETGASLKDTEAALAQFEKEKKIIRDGAQIWVVNFIKNQTNTSPKIIAGLKDDIRQVSSRKIKTEIARRYPELITEDTLSAEIEAEIAVGDTVYISHIDHTDTISIPLGEMEKEMEKEMEMEMEGEGEYTPPVVGASRLSKKSDCPCSEIAEIYNEILPGLLPVKRLTGTRKKVIQARWREDKERQSLDWWRGYFESVSASDYLMGRERRPGNNWQPDFDWLIKPANMIKVLEGKYANRGVARGAPELTYEEAMRNYSDPFGLHTEEVEALRKKDAFDIEGEEL